MSHCIDIIATVALFEPSQFFSMAACSFCFCNANDHVCLKTTPSWARFFVHKVIYRCNDQSAYGCVKSQGNCMLKEDPCAEEDLPKYE